MTDSSAASANANLPRVLAAAFALLRRDIFLLVRRPSRIAATILTPALLWAFFAGGFTDAVASVGPNAGDAYTRSLAAGAALLVATFTSVFGALGLIRDRETGYLQAVLVGPTPRVVVVASRVLSGALFAFLQAATMLLAAFVLADGVALDAVLESAVMLALAAVGLSGICAALAWHFRSIEGFHGVMSAVLMPAWMLSGAVFPPGETSGVLGAIMAANPLAYTHAAIAGPLGAFESGPAPTVVTTIFAIAGLIAAIASARGDAKR